MDDSKIIELYMERSEQAISETSKKYGRYCHYIATAFCITMKIRRNVSTIHISEHGTPFHLNARANCRRFLEKSLAIYL